MSPLGHRIYILIYWATWLALVATLFWFHDSLSWWLAFLFAALLAGAAPDLRSIGQLFLSDEKLSRAMAEERARISAFARKPRENG
jgi:hypothetical protein